MSWHWYDRHDIKDPIRDLVEGVVCACGLQYYGTRERIVRHVSQTSPRCATFYLQNVQPLAPDKIKRLDMESYAVTKALSRRGYRRVHADEPPERVHGPLQAEALKCGVRFETLLKKPRKQKRAPPLSQT